MTGTAKASFVHKKHVPRDFQGKLEQEMASVAESLVSLQFALALDTLQNKVAIAYCWKRILLLY